MSDAHVHLTIDPTLGVAAQAGVPLAERRGAMVRRAEAMLRAGITTARDLGGGDGEEIAAAFEMLGAEPVITAKLQASNPVFSSLMILVVALLAALYPALRASRGKPVDVLHCL